MLFSVEMFFMKANDSLILTCKLDAHLSNIAVAVRKLSFELQLSFSRPAVFTNTLYLRMAPLPTHIKYAVAFLGVFMGICIYNYDYDPKQPITIEWDQHQQELQVLRQKNANLERENNALKLTQKVASDSDNKLVKNWYDELIPES